MGRRSGAALPLWCLVRWVGLGVWYGKDGWKLVRKNGLRSEEPPHHVFFRPDFDSKMVA